MKQALWVVGGDLRQCYAAQYLAREGWNVHCHQVPEMDSEALPPGIFCLILPFPSLQGDGIRGCGTAPEELCSRLSEHSPVFGGLLEHFPHGRVFDLYGVEPFTTGNAAITAEGALQLAMAASPQTLFGANCLVAGFGRIGTLLAEKLRALGAKITVAARKPADQGLISALGYGFEQIGSYRGLSALDFLFNTVPAPIFTREDLEQLPAHCLLMELASAPGGFSPQVCRDLGLTVCPAPGLPGRCAPKSAGILYAQAIQAVLSAL